MNNYRFIAASHDMSIYGKGRHLMIAALEKILCVEDEPDVQSVIKRALVRVGKFNVMVCDNGQQVLLRRRQFF